MSGASTQRATKAPRPKRAAEPKRAHARITGVVAGRPRSPRPTGRITHEWADRFGLATVPLFEHGEIADPENHTVLLGGGSRWAFASFNYALSETGDPARPNPMAGSWAWSSDLTHHLTISGRSVALWCWDRVRPTEYQRSKVQKILDDFHSSLGAEIPNIAPLARHHVVGIFRRVRSLAVENGVDDGRAIDVFLAFLDMLIDRERTGGDIRRDGDAGDLLRSLPPDELDAIAREAERHPSCEALKFFPSLAVRYSGSAIFQEINQEYIREPLPTPPDRVLWRISMKNTRGGYHFTPPELARGIVETSLAQIENLRTRDVLTVLDPVCGTGTFLLETVRTLRRMGYTGRLRLIGGNIWAPVNAMARFSLKHAVDDWNPAGEVQIDLNVSDSLAVDLPPSDVVFMNPPRAPWYMMDTRQREHTRRILRARRPGEVDIGMVFVTHGLDALNYGGVLGAMLPPEILTLRSAERWRRETLERGSLRFLGDMGEFDLYYYGGAGVAAAVISKLDGDQNQGGIFRAAKCGNDFGSPEEALRMLRKIGSVNPEGSSSGKDWWLFDIPVKEFAHKPVWRVVPPPLERAISEFRGAGGPRWENCSKLEKKSSPATTRRSC